MCGTQENILRRIQKQAYRDRDDARAEAKRWAAEHAKAHTSAGQLRAENALLSQHKLSLEATVQALQGEIGRLETEKQSPRNAVYVERDIARHELSQAKKFLWQHSMHVWMDDHDDSDPSGVDLLKSLAEMRKYIIERDELRLQRDKAREEAVQLKVKSHAIGNKLAQLQFAYDKLFEDFCKLQACFTDKTDLTVKMAFAQKCMDAHSWTSDAKTEGSGEISIASMGDDLPAHPSQEPSVSNIPQFGESVLLTINQASWREQYLELKRNYEVLKEDYAALKLKEAELQTVVTNMLKDGFGQSICALRTFNGLHLFWVDPSDEACINERLHGGL
jgi:hypothetical protein